MQDAPRVDDLLEPRNVVARRCEHERRVADRSRAAFMAEGPWPMRALLRIGGLRDDVGNAERLAHCGPEPVGRLVVQVIGEPELRPLIGRTRFPVRRQSFGQRFTLRAQRTLSRLVAIAVVAAEGRRHLHAVTRMRQSVHVKPRYAPIARRRAMRRRLKRCVERDPHGPQAQTCGRGARNWLQARTPSAASPAPRRRARGGAPDR